MSSLISIKVDPEDFKEAEEKGYVYGQNISVRPIRYVYVLLGYEKMYEPKPWEPEGNKRFFVGCTVEVSESESDCDNGICIEIIKQASVIMYA